MRVELNEFPEVSVTLLWDNEQEQMRAVRIEIDILHYTGSLISDPIPPGDGTKGRRLTFHTPPSSIVVAATKKVLEGYCLPLTQTSAGVWVAADGKAAPAPGKEA